MPESRNLFRWTPRSVSIKEQFMDVLNLSKGIEERNYNNLKILAHYVNNTTAVNMRATVEMQIDKQQPIRMSTDYRKASLRIQEFGPESRDRLLARSTVADFFTASLVFALREDRIAAMNDSFEFFSKELLPALVSAKPELVSANPRDLFNNELSAYVQAVPMQVKSMAGIRTNV